EAIPDFALKRRQRRRPHAHLEMAEALKELLWNMPRNIAPTLRRSKPKFLHKSSGSGDSRKAYAFELRSAGMKHPPKHANSQNPIAEKQQQDSISQFTLCEIQEKVVQNWLWHVVEGKRWLMDRIRLTCCSST